MVIGCMLTNISSYLILGQLLVETKITITLYFTQYSFLFLLSGNFLGCFRL